MSIRMRKILTAFLAMIVALVLIFLVVRLTMLSGTLNDYDRALVETSQQAEANKSAIDKANERLREAGEPTVPVPDQTVAAPTQQPPAAGQPGPQGPPGAGGVDGRDGDTGPEGPAGPTGAPGPPGQNGENGAGGNQGEPGGTGPTGPPGPAGVDGAPGEKGATGDKGDKGDAGEKGDTGEKGDKGDKGDTGEAGPSGPPGKDSNIISVGCLDPGTFVITYDNGDGTTTTVVLAGECTVQ